MGLEVVENKIPIYCDFCGKEIKIDNYKRKANKHNFCNRECHNNYQKSMKTKLTCPVCGGSFYRKQSVLDKMKDVHNVTCSKKCCYELRKTLYLKDGNPQYGLTGKLNSSWKSDESNSGQYKLIRVEDHPFRSSSNFVPEHRLIAEQYLLNDSNSIEINGERYLKPECVVHHIDFNKKNNNVDNLFVFENEAIHTLFHNLYRSGRVKDLPDFLEYYRDTYINKLYNHQWLYRAYIDFDLSINQISKWFNIPYKSVQLEVYQTHLDDIKQQNRDNETFKNFVIKELSIFSQELTKNTQGEQYI